MGFSRQEYWSGLPCPPPGDLPNPGIEPVSLTSPALAGRFFTISATWEVQRLSLGVCWATRNNGHRVLGNLHVLTYLTFTIVWCESSPDLHVISWGLACVTTLPKEVRIVGGRSLNPSLLPVSEILCTVLVFLIMWYRNSQNLCEMIFMWLLG